MGKVSALLQALTGGALVLGPASHAGDRWTQYTSYAAITRMADGGSVLWLATSGGLIRLDKASGVKTYFNQANSTFTDSRVRALAADEAGRVWAATQGGMLAEFDGAGWSNLSTQSALDGQAVLDLAWDNQGSLWVLAVETLGMKPSLFRRQEGQWTRLYLEGVDPLIGNASSNGYGYGYVYGSSFSYGVYSYGSAYGVMPLYLQADGAGQVWVVARAGNRPKLYRIASTGRVDTSETPHHLNPRWFIVPRSGPPFWLCSRVLAKAAPAGWDTSSYPAGMYSLSTAHPRNLHAQAADGSILLSLNRLARYREGAWEEIAVPGDSLGSTPLLLESEAGAACPEGNCYRTARGDRLGRLAGESWTFLRTGYHALDFPSINLIRPRGLDSPDILIGGYGGIAAFHPSTSRVMPVDMGSAGVEKQAVYGLGEDHRGRIWVRGTTTLTRTGVDGVKTFTSGNSPWTGYLDYTPGSGRFMTEDVRGTVWVADSSRIISIPDGSEDVGTWKVHPLPPAPGREGGVAMKNLASHRDGSLWFSGRVLWPEPRSYNVIGRYDGKSWQVFDSSQLAWLDTLPVLDLHCDGAGQVWALTRAGLLQWDGTSWKEHARIQVPLLRNGIQALTVDAEGGLWAVTSPPDAALLRWNNRWEAVDASKGRMSTSSVRSMAFDGSGKLWMAMTWEGVMVFDPAGDPTTGMPTGSRSAQAPAPSLRRLADGSWHLFPGPLAGDDRLGIRIFDLGGAFVPGTGDEVRRAADGKWTWPGPDRRLPPGRYLLSLQGRQDRRVTVPFFQARP